MPNESGPNPGGFGHGEVSLLRQKSKLATERWPQQVSWLRLSLPRAHRVASQPAAEPGEGGAGAAVRLGRAGVSSAFWPAGQPAGDGAFPSRATRLHGSCRAIARAVRGRPGMRRKHVWRARKGKRGWSAAGKVLVFGIVKRDGLVKAQPIDARDRASVMQV